MSNQPSDRQESNTPKVRLRPGPGPGNPGKIEKAKDSRQALTRLLPYLKPYSMTLLLVLGLVICYTLLGLAGPYLMGIAIDDYIIPGDLPDLVQIALLMLITSTLCRFPGSCRLDHGARFPRGSKADAP